MDRGDEARYRRASIQRCESKRQYPTWAAAKTVAKRQHRNDGWDVMSPYRCHGCGRFHVGHPPEAY